jgi:hypothetical protein
MRRVLEIILNENPRMPAILTDRTSRPAAALGAFGTEGNRRGLLAIPNCGELVSVGHNVQPDRATSTPNVSAIHELRNFAMTRAF